MPTEAILQAFAPNSRFLDEKPPDNPQIWFVARLRLHTEKHVVACRVFASRFGDENYYLLCWSILRPRRIHRRAAFLLWIHLHAAFLL